jgi:hypothetical protein
MLGAYFRIQGSIQNDAVKLTCSSPENPQKRLDLNIQPLTLEILSSQPLFSIASSPDPLNLSRHLAVRGI